MTDVSNNNNNNIWSAILKTASSSKRIKTKNVLILGDSGSGKSTLAHYLKHQRKVKVENQRNDDGASQQAAEEQEQQHQAGSFIRTVASGGYVKSVKQDLDAETTKMLGVGYTSALVYDEQGEAILRLGIYQLGHEQLLSLLDPALTDDNLFGIIVLDWTKPWSFLESFQRWISVLERWSNKVTTNESKARVEEYLQKYDRSSDNNNNNNADITTTAAASGAADADVHADMSTLTINLGIPIAVVCCKSDTQKMLEEKYGYDEAQLDYIQQTLRCICMKYGAALFYTSTFHPSTFESLRQYIAHRNDPDAYYQSNNSNGDGSNSNKSTIPPSLRPHFVESTCVRIPAGWDTWNKIKALEENYECEEMDNAWDDTGGSSKGKAKSIYHEAVPEPLHESQDSGLQPTVTSEDEQALYARYFQPSADSRPPPPPPLSTTFLREWTRQNPTVSPLTLSTASSKENGYYGSLPSSPHRLTSIETSMAMTNGIKPHGKTPITAAAPPVSIYTTTTTATNTVSSASIPGNINTTTLTGYSSPSNNSNGDVAAAATATTPTTPPSSEILSQFFQKLLYKNMESTAAASSNSDDRRGSRSSVDTTTSGMHNRPPPPSCVNTT